MAGNELLGRHVADRAAAGRVGLGHRSCSGNGRLRGVKACFFRMQAARQAEVENLNQAAVGQHHILRLQVAMKDPQGMGGLQTVRNLNADREHELDIRRTARDQRIQRLPGNELHDDVGFFAGLTHFVDGADVGVLDRRCQPRLAQHGGSHLPLRQQTAAQDFEHHGPRQQRVVGEIHNTASACAKAAKYLVVLDHSSLHRCYKCTGVGIRRVS